MEVRLYLHIKRSSGKRSFAPVAWKNSKILPQRALVGGQIELHPEGQYYLCDSLDGKQVFRNVGKDAEVAVVARLRKSISLILLDLNGFKQVNDVYGHGIGDQVLTIVAQRLLGAMRDGDLAARLGGDEFAILALHLVGPEAATTVALRVIEALKEPVTTGSTRHQIGAGIGISLIPGDAASPEQALRKADMALYRAKEERRSAVRFFEDDMDMGSGRK
jgi:diguanylate cyclase (GGDEF)-like protein